METVGIFKLCRVSPTLDLSAFIVMLVRRGEAFCLYVFLCLCGGAMSFSRFGQTLKDVASVASNKLQDAIGDESLSTIGKKVGNTVFQGSITLAKGAFSAIEARNAEIVSLRADYAGRDSEELKSIVRSNGFLSSSSIEKAVALRILDERGDASEFRPLKGD